MAELSNRSSAAVTNFAHPRRAAGAAIAAFLLSGGAIVSMGATAIPGVVVGIQVLRAKPALWVRGTAGAAILTGAVGLFWWSVVTAMVLDGDWCLIPDVEPACPRPGLALFWVGLGVFLACAAWYGGKRLLHPASPRA
jgi:hypothetical protein